MSRKILLLLIGLMVLWSLTPFVWQILTSLKSDAEIVSVPATYLPSEPGLQHYQALFERKPFDRYLLNSFVVSGSATLLALLIGALAAYSFARLSPPWGRFWLVLLVGVALFPPILFFFPIYELIRAMHLINHPVSLIIPYVALNLPLVVLILTAFFREVPIDIEEAAKMDGLGRLGIFFRIVLPLSTPALVTTGILVFIFCWNEFLFALTFMTRDEARTVTAGVASLGGGSVYEIPWGPIAAAVVLSTLPLVILVLMFQRRIIAGLSSGAVKE